MNDETRAADTAETVAAKRPWHTPSVEEVDYAETSANPAYQPAYDGSGYASSF